MSDPRRRPRGGNDRALAAAEVDGPDRRALARRAPFRDGGGVRRGRTEGSGGRGYEAGWRARAPETSTASRRSRERVKRLEAALQLLARPLALDAESRASSRSSR